MPYQQSISEYQVMWLFCFFDLPTASPEEQKAAGLFRKNLLLNGFEMMQYSVYIRFCGSRQTLDVHKKRISSFAPSKGLVSLLAVTDKQFGDIVNYIGTPVKQKIKKAPQQLEFF